MSSQIENEIDTNVVAGAPAAAGAAAVFDNVTAHML